MRRLSTVAALSALTWVLAALPAVAAEGQTAVTGEGQWDGLVYGLILGVVVGAAVTIAAAGEPTISAHEQAETRSTDE